MNEIVHSQKQFIHASVKWGSGLGWDLTAVYDSPKPNVCVSLWEDLNRLEVGSCKSVDGH